MKIQKNKMFIYSFTYLVQENGNEMGQLSVGERIKMVVVLMVSSYP